EQARCRGNTERIEITGDTDVDHGDGRTRLPREHVDGRASCNEVRHHLAGDLLGPWRDAFDHDTVISGEHCDGRRRRDGWRIDTGDGSKLHAEVLDPAE